MRKWIYMPLFAAGCVFGQIELHDYMLPETGGESDASHVVSPDSRRHVDPHAGKEEEENADGAPDLQTLDMLQRMRATQIELTAADLKLGGEKDDLEKIQEVYLGGPGSLTVTVRTKEGRTYRSDIDNRTLLVDTGWGDVPVRLHEIREGVATESGFRLELAGGDRVEGRIPGFHLWITRLDGSERMISGVEMERVRFRALRD
jgi:hypothetical protein